MLKLIKNEFESVGCFGWLFMAIGVLTQLLVYRYTENFGAMSLVSGISGILSVVLCSQRRYAFYLFAWIQLVTYVWLAYDQRLWGEVVENIFYAGTMVAGMLSWFKNYNGDDSKIIVLKQSVFEFLGTCVLTCVLTALFWYMLSTTDDSQPALDAVSTVPAFVAQCLLMMRYRENWIFWLVIDVASVAMWLHAGNICMATQFVFWSLNCVYGYVKWSKR